jgi:hypothetical protein
MIGSNTYLDNLPIEKKLNSSPTEFYSTSRRVLSNQSHKLTRVAVFEYPVQVQPIDVLLCDHHYFGGFPRVRS